MLRRSDICLAEHTGAPVSLSRACCLQAERVLSSSAQSPPRPIVSRFSSVCPLSFASLCRIVLFMIQKHVSVFLSSNSNEIQTRKGLCISWKMVQSIFLCGIKKIQTHLIYKPIVSCLRPCLSPSFTLFPWTLWVFDSGWAGATLVSVPEQVLLTSTVTSLQNSASSSDPSTVHEQAGHI